MHDCRDGCNGEGLEVCPSPTCRHAGWCLVSAQCSLGPPGPSPAEQVPACTVLDADPTSPSCFVRMIPLPQGLGRPSQLGRAGQKDMPAYLLPLRYKDHQNSQTHQEWVWGRPKLARGFPPRGPLTAGYEGYGSKEAWESMKCTVSGTTATMKSVPAPEPDFRVKKENLRVKFYMYLQIT